MKIIAFINVVLLLTDAFLITRIIGNIRTKERPSKTEGIVLAYTAIPTFIISLITAFSIL